MGISLYTADAPLERPRVLLLRRLVRLRDAVYKVANAHLRRSREPVEDGAQRVFDVDAVLRHLDHHLGERVVRDRLVAVDERLPLLYDEQKAQDLPDDRATRSPSSSAMVKSCAA